MASCQVVGVSGIKNLMDLPYVLDLCVALLGAMQIDRKRKCIHLRLKVGFLSDASPFSGIRSQSTRDQMTSSFPFCPQPPNLPTCPPSFSQIRESESQTERARGAAKRQHFLEQNLFLAYRLRWAQTFFFVRVGVCFTKARSRYEEVRYFLSGYSENAIRLGNERRKPSQIMVESVLEAEKRENKMIRLVVPTCCERLMQIRESQSSAFQNFGHVIVHDYFRHRQWSNNVGRTSCMTRSRTRSETNKEALEECDQTRLAHQQRKPMVSCEI
jgi:hypothetical protein